MKNFTNNFKQFTSRLSARWLIMALMMLVGTSSAWAKYTIYYVNVNGWANPYCYAWILNGSSEATWEGKLMTKTGEKCLGYDVYKYDGTDDSSNRCIFSNKGANQTDDLTINKGKYYYNDKWYASISEIESEFGIDYLEILKGNKIAFYIGEPSSWNQSKFYLRKNSTTKASTNITFISGNNRLGVVSTAAETDLYVTHDESWQGEMINQAPVAGGAYLCNNSDGYSGCQNLNITALDYSFTLTETTIKTGETCSITEGTKPTTYQGNSTSIRYFVTTDNTNFTEVTFQDGALQTGSLAVGTYTIRPLITDGIIYAIGTDKTLTVETACDKPEAPIFGTDGVEVCEGTQVTLPTIAGVTLKWYDENNQETTETFYATENKTYYAVVVDDCESDKTSYTITIKTKPTVSLNPTENTVCTDVTLGDITDYVEIESTNDSQISWYAAAQGGDALATSTPLMKTSYFAEATLNGCSSDRAEFTITDVLSAPTEVPNVTAPETICDGESAQERGVVMQRLSCINKLSKNLKVIIPEKPLVQGSGDFMWPQIPADFDADKRKIANGIPTGEQVTAGLGYGETLIKFADNIEIEYGAAIKGVENLVEVENNNNISRYGSATTHFTAPRSKWILVGNVVQPWIDDNDHEQGVRNLKSGDYYITTDLPRVYMHQVVLSDGGVATWDVPFGSLEEELEPGEVFAIMIPDQYGKYKVPANYYNKKYVKDGNYFDANEEIEYGVYKGTKGPFTGKFINDNGEHPISFTGLEQKKYYLLNNSYPCNIDAKQITTGKIQFYDATAGSFKSVDAVPTVHLKPQHGFIFQPNDGVTSLNITSDMLVDANTRSRSADVEMPLFSLNLFNANTNVENSNVVIRYDEFLGEGNLSEADVEKAFAPNTLTPELYIISNDGKYSSVDVSSTSQAIPLGIRIKYSMNVKFEKVWFRGFSKVILVDKLKDVECDLLEKTYTTETLSVGDLEGRFFLYLEEDVPEEEPEEGGDVSTEVEENSEDIHSINILVKEKSNTISVVTNGVELKTIHVSDMAGKTMSYKASGYSTNIKLPVPKGVYLIQVIGDKANRTEKVILK